MTTLPLLPPWLTVTWSVVLIAVVAVHLHHCRTMAGQARWWHLGHSVMAVGMIAMYLLPVMSDPVLAWTGFAVFALITVAILFAALILSRRENSLNPLWVATGLDMLAMTYMFLPMSAQPALLTWAAIIYLTAHAIAWSFGAWARVPLYANPAPGPTLGPAESGELTAVKEAVGVGLTGRVDPGVRVTLAIMTVSMAYMLLAMSQMPAMSPMPTM